MEEVYKFSDRKSKSVIENKNVQVTMKHTTYLNYFLDLKKVALEDSRDTDKDFQKIFFPKLLDKVKESWQDFETGERDSYMLTDSEIEKLWNDTTIELTSNMISRLTDFGYVKMGVNTKGEIVYSITEDGLEYISNIKK